MDEKCQFDWLDNEHFGFVDQHPLVGRDIRRALLGGATEQLRLQPVNLFQEQRGALGELSISLRKLRVVRRQLLVFFFQSQ
jgi:hypothetical protein